MPPKVSAKGKEPANEPKAAAPKLKLNFPHLTKLAATGDAGPAAPARPAAMSAAQHAEEVHQQMRFPAVPNDERNLPARFKYNGEYYETSRYALSAVSAKEAERGQTPKLLEKGTPEYASAMKFGHLERARGGIPQFVEGKPQSDIQKRAEPATWRYNKKTYLTSEYVLSSAPFVNPKDRAGGATGHGPTPIKRGAQTYKDAIARGERVGWVGGVPKLMAANEAPPPPVEHYVRFGDANPKDREGLVLVDGPVFMNLLRSGWDYYPNRGFVRHDAVISHPLGGLADEGELTALIARARLNAELTYVTYRRGEANALCIKVVPHAGEQITAGNVLHAIARLLGLTAYAGELDGAPPRTVMDVLNENQQKLDEPSPFEGLELITPTTQKAKRGMLAAAAAAGFCAREALEAWSARLKREDDWSAVPDYCSEADLEAIAHAHCMTIKVHTQSLAEPLYEWRSCSNDKKGSTLALWYSHQHVFALESTREPRKAAHDAPIVWYDAQEALLAAEAEISRAEPVWHALCERAVDEDAAGVQARGVGFSTQTHHHRLRFPGAGLAPGWTQAAVARAFFNAQQGHPLLQSSTEEMRRVRLVNRSDMWEKQVVGEAREAVVEYDQIKAFASYLKCPNYSGFPSPVGPYHVCAWDPAILEGPYEGLAWVQRPAHLQYPHDTVIEAASSMVPFPQLRLALARGEQLEVRLAMCSARCGDVFAETKAAAEAWPAAHKKLWFNSLVGIMQAHSTTEKAFVTSPDENDEVQRRRDMRCVMNLSPDIWLCESWARVDEPYTEEAVVAAYVLCYQKLTLLQDFLLPLAAAGLYHTLVRVWVDGACTDRPVPFEVPADRWKVKPLKSTVCLTTTQERARLPVAIRAEPPAFDADELRLLVAPRVALLGPAGSGKTTRVRGFWAGGGRKLLLTATTYVACRQLGEEAITVAHLLTLAKKQGLEGRLKGCDRLCVDEFSMLTVAEAEAILDLKVPVLFVGDLLQLKAWGTGRDGPVSEEWLAEKGFVFERLERVRRAGDERTLALYAALRGQSYEAQGAALRAAGVAFLSSTDSLVPPKAGEQARVFTGRNDEADELNVRYAEAIAAGGPVIQWGVTAAREEKGAIPVKAPVCPGMLVVAVRNRKGSAGKPMLQNNVVGVVQEVKKSTLVVDFPHGTIEAKFADLAIGWAGTYHRAQGQTLDCPVVAVADSVWTPEQLYVGCSRVRSLGQLTVVHHAHADFGSASQSRGEPPEPEAAEPEESAD